ncbi:MAG: TIGR04211 family SH3 domain-containing protein [Pseudomonadota bacterium]
MIKRLACLLGCWLLAWCPAAAAQNHYITDSIQVTLRSGPAMDRKIIAMLNSGQPLEVIEKGEEWSQVRLPSGREGWVLTRLIQTELPLKVHLTQLQQRYDALLANSGTPAGELKRLGEENTALSEALAQTRQQLADLAKAHRQLEDTSANASAIRDQRDRLAKEVAEVRSRLDVLSREVTAARSKNNMWWFMAGAGVLLLGFVIGLSMRSRRKRSSYY